MVFFGVLRRKSTGEAGERKSSGAQWPSGCHVSFMTMCFFVLAVLLTRMRAVRTGVVEKIMRTDIDVYGGYHPCTYR